MDIHISHSAPAATSLEVPGFPLVRFDTGLVVYQEALINGQYLVANGSAMGRPKPREWVWKQLSGGAASVRPLRTRQHAFQLEVDGQLLVDRWEWVDAREAGAGRPGCRESVVVLRHTQRSVTVEVHTRLDDTPFVTRWLTITNTSDQHVAVARVFPWSGQAWEAVGHPWITTELPARPDALFSLGRFTDTAAGAEGSFDWMPLPSGAYGFETLHGRSGWGAPFFILRNEVTGEALVVHFAWSGNWQVGLFNDFEPARELPRDARLYVRVGLAGPAPLRVLEPSESAHTPAVHFGFLFGDLDTCVQALHTHERRSVILPQPADKVHRVEVNHTGYTRNAQITETQLREEMDVAADVGVELFMLDAGWFGEVSDRWFEAVGDWDRESPLLSSGVKAAFDYARSRGMLCGLWVEAERMGLASRLLHHHPDWPMEKRGEKIPNLDLSKPEVAQYAEETIVGLIEKYQLDCFRLDYNISTGEGGEAQRGGYTENISWRYYEAFYGIFDRIRARFPDLLLENCSSGGGRTDLGMLSRFHWTQITDRWSPALTLKIVNGLTMSLPPEQCMTLLGAISDGVADIDFMLQIGLFGHFCVSGIFPTLAEQQTKARKRWRHAIELYKSFVRPMLSTCRMFHHTPIQRQTEPGDWVVLECASQDSAKGYAGIFRLATATEAVHPRIESNRDRVYRDDAFHLYPQGLDVGRRYRVTYDTSGQSREMDGGALVDLGLRVKVSGAFTSELVLFEAI
jgi:alpha-galactosidase